MKYINEKILNYQMENYIEISPESKNIKISDEIRRLIISKVEQEGEPIAKVARDFKLKQQSVFSIIKLFSETGRSENLNVLVFL